MSLVVRCPACGGASRVESDALGHMVGCPRCHTPFVAEEAPDPVPPIPAPAPKRARPARARPVRADAPRTSAVVPIAPPRAPQTGAQNAPQARQAQDHEHDPVAPPATGGLPLSVMVGFALMPFGIPILWLLGPVVTGFDAAVSIAVPASLAVAAAALCLGIVYTIDWTGTTRLKGVFMLVGLAYLSAAGLYFLKPELVVRIQKFFALPAVWFPVYAEVRGEYYVKMPGAPAEVAMEPLAGARWVLGRRVAREVHTGDGLKAYTYLFAVTDPNNPKVQKPDDAWFAALGQELQQRANGRVVRDEPRAFDAHPGREWELRLPDDTVRIVRVFVIEGRVYYLSAEGPGLTPEDPELSKHFFDSFARSSAPKPAPVAKKGRR